MDKEIIVTFSCSNAIHVYKPKCSVLPRYPYKSHETLEKAKEHLNTKGITDPEIITKI